jgi:hypothetical protein
MQQLLAVTLGGLSLCNAAYTLQKDFGTNSLSFFDNFEFYISAEDPDGPDPTHGVVNVNLLSSYFVFLLD